MNFVQEELLIQERNLEADALQTPGDLKGINLNNKSMGSMGDEDNGFIISEPCQTSQLTLIVDYTNIAEDINNNLLLFSDGFDSDLNFSQTNGGSSQSSTTNNTIQNYIQNHEASMSNEFTIYEITQSDNCEYVYVWIVNKCEYNSSCYSCLSGNGGKKPVHVTKEEGSGSFLDPYILCLN